MRSEEIAVALTALQHEDTMSETIEKVAAAISHRRQKHRYGSVMTPWGDSAMAESFRREQLEIASDAIEAMRFTDDYFAAVVKALRCRDDEMHRNAVRQVHQAWIDAAINAEERQG
jgi:hypothetical protein